MIIIDFVSASPSTSINPSRISGLRAQQYYLMLNIKSFMEFASSSNCGVLDVNKGTVEIKSAAALVSLLFHHQSAGINFEYRYINFETDQLTL